MRIKKQVFILITLIFCFVWGTSLTGCSAFYYSEPILPHLIAESEKEANPVRFITSQDTMSFTTTADSLKLQLDELEMIISDYGKMPDFTGAHSSVKAVFDEAVKVLNRYIKNDFTTFERVHAIHDYLSYFVKYDDKLYDEFLQGIVSSNNDSFTTKGVFINKRAVCDGYAKAFRLLCGIEGIESRYVQGIFSYDGQTGVNHSWNKVKIDNKWYNIDTTFDNLVVDVDGGADQIKVIHHGYFLLSDQAFTVYGGHVPSQETTAFAATENYPFHANHVQDAFGDVTMEVNSQSELIAAFERIAAAKGKIGQIEMRLNMGLSEEQAAQANAYEEEIKAAYKKVRNSDFKFTTQGTPYLKFPNSVFVFLIYK